VKAAVVGIWVAALALGAGQVGRAQPPPARVALRWNAPDECPDDAELIRAVEKFLGEPLTEAPAQALAISVNVAGSGATFAAKLGFKGPAGIEERYLEHPECPKLMEAVALLVALAIDPERVKAREREPSHDAQAASTPSAAPTPAPTEPPRQPLLQAARGSGRERDQAAQASPLRSKRVDAWRSELEVFGFATSGILPKVGPGLGAAFDLQLGHFELGLVGNYFLPRTDPVPISQHADIELSLWTLGARACGLPWLGDWAVRGCLSADFGDLAGTGTGQGLEHARTRHARFSALGAGVSLRYGQRRLSPLVGLSGAWALERPPFGVNLDGKEVETFRSDTLSVRGFVGLSYTL
jgi:hypothetical protein